MKPRKAKPRTEFKLRVGEDYPIHPQTPIISAKPGYGYIWIGNDSMYNKGCWATLSGRKTLLALAAAIRRAAK